jgi:hypothetical protein
VGVFCRATFDEVASGKPLHPDRVVCFATREGESSFRDRVANAFVNGQFRPSELLFYFESMDHQLKRYGHPNDWPTPGAVTWRKYRTNQQSAQSRRP